jgi:exonuclease V
MSCQPLPPSQRHDQSIVNNVDDSDYGSDFSADETELVNQLLAKADAPVPLPVVIPAPLGPFAPQQQLSPTRQIQTQVPAVIVRDVEDCDEDVSNGRKPRVLGKEKPPWQVRRAGNGALSDARANKTGWIPVFGGAAIGERSLLLPFFFFFFSPCLVLVMCTCLLV